MKVDLKRTFLVSALAAMLAFAAAPLFAAPAFAQTLPADVVLYETTENMKITGPHYTIGARDTQHGTRCERGPASWCTSSGRARRRSRSTRG
ncbi:MAG: hypothetical protein HYS77_12265, partial [Candidatus Rokubacteria bacterium]|nr:hypothetical protein [Candidatus Rokubacteria bacterium]